MSKLTVYEININVKLNFFLCECEITVPSFPAHAKSSLKGCI